MHRKSERKKLKKPELFATCEKLDVRRMKHACCEALTELGHLKICF